MMKPSIAVIGASTDRYKFGNKCVRAYAAAGYDVFPVHPTAATVEGLPAYRSITDVPRDALDRVSVYLPPKIGEGVMAEIASKSVGDVWLNPGADGVNVIERAKQLGLHVICACSIVDLGVTPEQFPDS